MGRIKKYNEYRLRLECDCGEYIHDLERDADTGEIKYEYFRVTPKPKPEDKPKLEDKPKSEDKLKSEDKRKGKKWSGFFDNGEGE